MKKKLLVVFLALASAVSFMFALSACDLQESDDGGNDNNHTHTHTFADTWSFDSQDHWHAATCGHDEKSDLAPHELKDGVCTVCGARLIGTEGLLFSLSDDASSYIVASVCAAKAPHVIIPSIYNDLPVTSIASRAFFGSTSLTGITIPDSVTSIGENAFA